MTTLKRAHRELYQRTADEMFSSLEELEAHCQRQRARSREIWTPPGDFEPQTRGGDGLVVQAGSDGAFALNDWSFGQICRLAGISKETVNRLSASTASLVLRETLPHGKKPLMLFAEQNGQDGTSTRLRSVHGTAYTRLHNADLLDLVHEFARDFTPPQEAAGGGTGLYCGEQDMFCFLIDPTGWAEIGGEAFAPGFFLWNSEVGRRSLGIQTFWFQAVCQNHIVWDAVEVVEFTRKHTANVHEGLAEIRRIIERLVQQRDSRRDGFVNVLKKAMRTKLGDSADDALKVLFSHGIPRGLAHEALETAKRQGAFTIFALVDALTRLTQQLKYAGDRTDADLKVASLLALAV